MPDPIPTPPAPPTGPDDVERYKDELSDWYQQVTALVLAEIRRRVG
ncbi:MAG: hypothetical protein M3280_01385 [Actinomycetota bacterium]|nr:hypothetical protein [Actinomycetota bacterium]